MRPPLLQQRAFGDGRHFALLVVIAETIAGQAIEGNRTPSGTGIAQIVTIVMRRRGGREPEDEHQGIEAELDEDPPRQNLEYSARASGEEEIT